MNIETTKIYGFTGHFASNKSLRNQKVLFALVSDQNVLTPERIQYLCSEKLLKPIGSD